MEVIADEGNYTDDNCRTFSPPSPVALEANDYAEFVVQVDFSAAGTFAVFRTTVNLLPQ